MNNPLITRHVFTRAATYISRRNYSSHGPEESLSAYRRWVKVSYFGFPLLTLVYLYNYLNPEAPQEVVPYPFMKIRSKDFPWGDGDTDLFSRKH